MPSGIIKRGYTRGSGIFEDFLAKKRANMANSLINEDQRRGRLLDIGCGAFPYFLTTTKFQEKYGVDNISQIQYKKYKKISFARINIEQQLLPFAANYFDVVTMLAVFEHINHDRLHLVLTEVSRVLKHEGTFILTTPSPWSAPLLVFLSRIRLISKVEIEDHKHEHTSKEIKKYLTNAGFRQQDIASGYFELFLNMYFRVKKRVKPI